MKTDELIDMLAQRAGTLQRGSATGIYGKSLAAGALVTATLMLVVLGPRHDLVDAVGQPMFWVKLAYVAALATVGVLGAFRMAIPGAPTAWMPKALLAIAVGIALIAVFALLESDGDERSHQFFGSTWKSCPWLVAGLSIPVFVAVVHALRKLAPTRLRWAGAAAGFASGSVAALVYSFHCPELEAPFIATWYTLGILVPTALGALLGRRLLRW